jgi:dipeptide/tripeptide permease
MDVNNTVRNIGMGLMVIGISLIVGFGIYNVLTALLTTDVNWIVKVSITAIILGVTLALFSLLKEKLDKSDTQIQRKY